MKKMRSIFFALVAFSAVTLSLHGLWESEAGLVIERLHIGDIPVTVMRKSDSPPAPAIVIAHGFSGSQQLMAPIATTLARNGYVAVTFDFSGHGRNPTPMPGGLAKLETSTAALLNDIDEVVRFAQRQPWADGRVALVGHSMATDLVVRHAIRDPQIAAVAAFSFFGEGVTRDQPKNLIIIDGAWESQRLIEAGVRVVSQSADATAQAGVTYGDIARGTGRRLAIARGVEHIGVLYSRDAMTETLNWMNAVFGRSEAGYIDARGPWLALLFAGLIALDAAARAVPAASLARSAWRRAAMAALGAHRDSASVADAAYPMEGADGFPADPARRLSRRSSRGLRRPDIRRPVARTGRLASPSAAALEALCSSRPSRLPLCTRSFSACRSTPMSSLTCRRAFARRLSQ